jgi:hypothetical protein
MLRWQTVIWSGVAADPWGGGGALCSFIYRRCILYTLYGAVDFLIVLSKGQACMDRGGWGGGRGAIKVLYAPELPEQAIKFLYAPASPPPTVWALNSPSWALVHKTTYAPMIYMSLCVMLLMRAASIAWASGRGLGAGNLRFFGPQMALAYWPGTISQGPKNRVGPKISISRAQPPPTCPRNGCCPHQKHYAPGRINHRCINTYLI